MAWQHPHADGLLLPRSATLSVPFRIAVSPLPALICFCTCPDTDTADRLARTLVEERLAACVQRLPGVRSVYRWQGRVESADEHLLLIKTAPAQWPALQARVLDLHPHDVPELIAVETAAGLPAYLDWIQAQTGVAA